MPANEALRDFLRVRRARLAPADVDLEPGTNPRRVPGLRREELAHLAGVSVDYYTRLEQGRPINASDEVLRAVAAALRLRADERDYFLQLAGRSRTGAAGAPYVPDAVRPGLAQLVHALPTPAFVLGRALDVLVTNAAARALLCDFDALEPRERNHARWVFLDPEARRRYREWAVIARDNVAALRMQSGRHPEDERLAALIAELQEESAEFAAWWTDHEVTTHSHGVKHYRHPDVGELTIAYEAFPVPGAPDQRLYLYTAEPGSASERALQRLV